MTLLNPGQGLSTKYRQDFWKGPGIEGFTRVASVPASSIRKLETQIQIQT